MPEIGERLVTASPDVSTSTGLSGWINKVGLFSQRPVTDFEAGRPRLLDWKTSPRGRHIELGLSEMNLFTIGTLYDPFVCRGLDALIFGLYSASRFIFAGTPSGVSLSPEGGAHQSSVTASLGMELPSLDYYEPCFASEVEWALMEPALRRLGRALLRGQALAGGYLVYCGAMIPECIAAAEYLEREGVGANVIHLTSPRRAFEDWRRYRANGRHILAALIPPDQRAASIVTVQDSAASALAWMGSVFGQPTTALGVCGFGQPGSRKDLSRCMHIDADSILEAAFAAVDATGG